MSLIYTGIGSRKVPEHVAQLMFEIGKTLAIAGWTLRSGGALGSDMAFEAGCDAGQGAKEIYLPWRRFNQNASPRNKVSQAALNLAAHFHPNWNSCADPVKNLHGRNCYQVLGKDLITPTKVIICWTKGGHGNGGTGQAIRMAKNLGIEVHDLGKPEVLEDYQRHFSGE